MGKKTIVKRIRKVVSVRKLFVDFSFSEALALLKAGHKMTRTGWNGKHTIQMQLPDSRSANTLPYLFITTEKGARVPWVASQTDLLASDWQIK